MSGPRIGELFAGYGGLGLGVQAVVGGEVAWFSEFDVAPSTILATRFPGVPNHGDITTIDWSAVEPVDVLTGGFPCQDVSLAGARAGVKEGTRSGLWSHFATAIEALQPRLVVIENVRGLLSAAAGESEEWTDEEISEMESGTGSMGEPARADGSVLNAFGSVLGDLARLGFHAEWCGVRASDAGSCHQRFRVFIIAYPASERRREGWTEPAGIEGRLNDELGSGSTSAAVALLPTVTTAIASGGNARRGGARSDELLLPGVLALMPTPTAIVANDGEGTETWLARREKVKLTANNGNGMGMPLTIAAALLPTVTVQDASNTGGASQFGRNTLPLNTEVTMLPTPAASDATGGRISKDMGGTRESGAKRSITLATAIHHAKLEHPEADDLDSYKSLWDALEDQAPYWRTDKVDYWPAINRWANVVGRPAPSPTVPDGKGGSFRLNPAFTEWMMGLPAGWITDCELTRNQKLKACGNGVVWQQAALALTILLRRLEPQPHSAQTGDPRLSHDATH